MNYKQLKEKQVRAGDVIIITKKYQSIGDSTYGGPVISANPLIIFPYSGNHGYKIVDGEPNESYNIIRIPFLHRMMNIRNSRKIIRGGK